MREPAPNSPADIGFGDRPNPMLVAGDLVNEVSWSKSTAENFESCQRKYFLHKYGAWGGWLKTHSERARRLYMLKNLDSRAGWVGKSIHAAAKRTLERERKGELVDVDSAIAETTEKMEREYAQSRRHTYRQVKKGFGLIEHELGEVDETDVGPLTKAVRQAEQSVRALLGSSTYARAVMAPAVMGVDEMDGFMLERTKIFVAPDLAFTRPEDAKLELVDWKTGRPKSSDSEQLVIYAAYAEQKWRMPADAIVGRLVYTKDELAEPSFPVERIDVALFKQTTLRSIAAMRAKHGQPEEAFPKTTNTRACDWCNFRGECWPGLGRDATCGS